MKGKINIIARKTFALIIATAMSIPTGMMARADEVKVYEQGSSVMNIMENPEDIKELAKTQDNTKEVENELYKIESKAKLDESLEKIIYEIKVSKKANQNEETNDSSNLNLKFTPNPNSNIKGLKVLSAKANSDSGLTDIEVKENEISGDLNSLLVEAKAYDEIIMEVEADTRQAKENRTYDLYIGLDDGENKLDSTYNLLVNKKILTENEEEKEVLTLDLNQKETDNLQGEIQTSDLLSFLQPKDTILWTDYLANFDEEMKKVSYDLKLDDKQETTDTKISIDYYENTKEGFILKKDFAQATDFAEKIEFEIPQGYIAKLSLKTKIDKKDTNTPNYSLNNRQVKNPRYEKKNSDQTKEEAGEDEGESDKSQDSIKEETDSDTSDTQIVVKDSNGNEIPVEEEVPAEKNQPEISAIILNKDTLVNNLKENGKLTEGLESIIEEISEDLNAYNDEKITEQELKDFTKSIVDRTGIEKTDLRYYFEAILSGLNKQKNKAANLNIDEIITYAYPEEKPTAEENLEDKKEALEKTPDQKENTTNTTDNKKTEDNQSKEEPEKNQGLLAKLKGLMISDEEVPTPQKAGEPSSLENKKFTIMTRYETSNASGPIQVDQFFTIKLDDRLTVKDPNTLKKIVYNGEEIATPTYDANSNTIKYTVTKTITDNVKIPLNIDVDYNVQKIKDLDGDATLHSIKNSITGVGVTKAVSFPETVVDNEGNVVNQIIEPGSKDVLEIVDQGEDYQVHMDVSGSPIVKDGELESIDWTVRFSSTKDLLELGLISNATLVKGSGLSRYENITINGKPINLDDITTNPIEGKLGIRESKNHTLKESTKDVTIRFQTPVFNKQQKYMIDFSVLLKNRKKSGAVRLVFDKGYSDEQVKEKTSKRIGMNNRTTIMGEFTSEDTARWTVTDGVSTGDDNNGLPLATRDLTGAQTLDASRMAVYGIDETTGKMVIKTENPGIDGGIDITGIPEKESNPDTAQVPGTIAVYEYDTLLTDSNAGYSMGGVNINKYQDLTIKQTWAGIDLTKKMPAQGFVVQDENGKVISPEISVPEGIIGKADREITIPSAKYWDIKTDADQRKQD